MQTSGIMLYTHKHLPTSIFKTIKCQNPVVEQALCFGSPTDARFGLARHGSAVGWDGVSYFNKTYSNPVGHVHFLNIFHCSPKKMSIYDLMRGSCTSKWYNLMMHGCLCMMIPLSYFCTSCQFWFLGSLELLTFRRQRSAPPHGFATNYCNGGRFWTCSISRKV